MSTLSDYGQSGFGAIVNLASNTLGEDLDRVPTLNNFLNDNVSGIHIDGGTISLTGGVNFNIASGHGYAIDSQGKLVEVTWGTINSTCIYNGDNYISINDSSSVVITNTTPGPDIIALGYINTTAGNTVVAGIANVKLSGKDYYHQFSNWVRYTIGSLVEYGCNLATQTSPNQLKITMGSGKAWTLLSPYTFPDTSTFVKLLNSSDYGYVPDTVTQADTISVGYINNPNNPAASALVPMTTSYYKKDMFFLTPNGVIYYVYAIAEYATLDEAKAAPYPPVPETIRTQIIRLAGVVTQQGATSVSDIIDLRPTLFRIFESGASAIPSTVVSHNDLTDLSVDSHTQYHTDARGDARYYRKTETDTFLSNKSDSNHTHSNATTSTAGFLSAADKTKLDTVENNANNYVHPNHSGDVVSVADGATTIQTNVVSNAKLAQIPAVSLKGRISATTGDVTDLSSLNMAFLNALNSNYYTDFFSLTGTPFSSVVSGTGAAITSVVSADPSAAGVVQLATGTSLTGRAAFGDGFSMLAGGSTLVFMAKIQVPTLWAATDDFVIRIGFGDITTGSDNVDSPGYFEYDGFFSANWRLCTSNNSLRTKNDSGVAIQAQISTTWTYLKVIVNATGTQADFYINNSLVGSITTNIPVANGRQFGVSARISKLAGSSSRTFVIDKLFYASVLSSLDTGWVA